MLLRRLKTEVSYFFLLDKTDLNKAAEASERIFGIFRELKEQDPGLTELLARYTKGLLEYKGVELNIEPIVDQVAEPGGKSMLAQSFEELVDRGIEKGHRDLVETARRILLKGIDVEETARLTGLSVEEIDSLQ